MKGCGGVIYDPGHVNCAGELRQVDTWTYQGYGVMRVFAIRHCATCGYVDDHHKLSETPRLRALTSEQVRLRQKPERERRDAIIAALKEKVMP